MKADVSKRIEELLVELQECTIKELLDRAKDGSITSAEAGTVVQLCKLNNVTIDITEGDIDAETKDALKGALEDESVIVPFASQKAG